MQHALDDVAGNTRICQALTHGAWRLKGLGPGAPDFHAVAAAAHGVGAVAALRALAASRAGPQVGPGRYYSPRHRV